MRISYFTLITVILSIVSLFFILSIAGVFRSTVSDDASTCAASVLTRVNTIDAALPSTELKQCRAEYVDISGSPQHAQEDLLAGFERCARSFQPAIKKPIVKKTASYCHVCGIYQAQTPEAIPGFSAELMKVSEKYFGTQEETSTEEALILDEELSIIFFQDRTDEFSLLTALMPKEWTAATIGATIGVGVGVAAVTYFTGGTGTLPVLKLIGAGAVIGAGGIGGAASGYVVGYATPHPEGMIRSGILIRPHNQEFIEAIG